MFFCVNRGNVSPAINSRRETAAPILMTGLCQFKSAFGEPGAGAHAWRVAGLAGTDLLPTVAAAGLLSYATQSSFLAVFIILMIIAFAAHEAFCVKTALNVAVKKLIVSDAEQKNCPGDRCQYASS